MMGPVNATGIYRIRVSRGELSPKFYIGHAAIFRKRRDKHFGELRRGVHKNQALQRAFHKYGEASFSFEIVIVCEKSAILELYEQRLLDTYDESEVYNLCRTCVGSKLGIPMSAATKAKISAANKGRRPSPENIEAVARATRARVVTMVTRAKMSASRMGNKNAIGHVQTPEHRLKSTRHFIGKRKPQEEILRRLATRRANAIERGYY